MTQAKITLVLIAVLAFVGGALAFKANRIITVYYGKSTIYPEDIGACTEAIATKVTLTLYNTTLGFTTQLSISPNPDVTACTTRVVSIL
ncbi:hypothetical protein [Chitinophaga ginsengisegetis]|uniref:hypothetical protein n=1 Tax=Chitinophaga ginsengisegetis TaxID=393003 RepID=UPI000DBA6795|nr:hypothetical protein [Chitinophaga ginsengisegetis]MDR6567449.1 hypothetical protein [Chitinophaga ginsengisegetis]MDR6647180.1 hypothetical protein [Chitinophaga ginsengisegetis]MDR6653529.1 hypothetical protein [Chitinophaga ginsengisegetis]